MKTRYAASAFDGEGPRRFGGRWNSPGVRVAYASETLSLATLEVLVHIQRTAVLASYSICGIQFDPALVEALPATDLLENWREYPAPAELAAIGDAWVKEVRSVMLGVPSVIVPGESNYLVNPAHPAFAQLVVRAPEPFVFDARLVGRSGQR